MIQKNNKTVYLTVLVAALGYFVDIYDLLLFSIVRVASLKDIGVPEEELLTQGVFLINVQMLGLLLGGIFWGVLGDLRGRLSVLFGSIFLYSVANFLNGFVDSVTSYAVLRFIAGVGLAGELGAGITLVAEILPKERRGLGTTVVASVGILGAVVGGVVADFTHWRTAYMIGGGLGFCLLALRIGIAESDMFDSIKGTAKNRGNFLLLFMNGKNFLKYVSCILIGVPIWYVIGVLITFSPEISQKMNMMEFVSAGKAVMWSYLGLSLGDLSSGLLSQHLKSRKRAVLSFLAFTVLTTTFYLNLKSPSLSFFYFVCALLGFATGYWAVFVTIAAEQFGTNLRSTVATTVPNFVRGSVIPLTLCFNYLAQSRGVIASAALVGLGCFTLSALALWRMEESFHKDLNYLE
ncbi:MAG: MFS transporter [Bdellovibrionales bacterium]|nr:MFS transporter [Bdellovibrionales bacterium]